MDTVWDNQAELALVDALRRGADDIVEVLCRQFVAAARSDAPLTSKQAIRTIRALQEYYRVDQIPDIAEVAMLRGLDAVAIKHRYALALLDAQRVALAQALLESLPDEARRTHSDVRGAVARVHKERFLSFAGSAIAPVALAEAIRLYHASYEHFKDSVPEWTYHGVNATALLWRAAEDDIELDGIDDPLDTAEGIARRILYAAADDETDDAWLAASATEAALCLGDQTAALEHLQSYLAAANANAFAINSTLRQLRRVWKLDTASDPGGALIALLQARLVQAEGRVTLSDSALSAKTTSLLERAGTDERVTDVDAYRSIRWIARGIEASRSVARISGAGGGIGTGFVLDSAEFGSRPGWPARVVVSAAHVIGIRSDWSELRISFPSPEGTAAAPQPLMAPRVLWTGTSDGVDACVLAMPDGVDTPPALTVRSPFPDLDEYTGERKTFIIGYPHAADEPKLTMIGSNLTQPAYDRRTPVELLERYAWYLTSTTKGISGGPLFDDSWRVIAVHKGYDGQSVAANWGIRLDCVRRAVAASPEGGF